MVKHVTVPAILIAMTIAVALCVQFAQRYTGPLELHQRFGSYGGANFATGSTEYPRIVDDSEGYALKVTRPARTVASQYWSIDDYVYSLIPPESVVAVSQSAYDHSYSNVFKWADLFHPVVATDPEVILKVNPDLLLVSSEGRADFTSLLRAAGTPVFRTFTTFTKLAEIAPTIRLIGYLTGRDSEAARVAEDFERAVVRAQSRKPAGAPAPRILGFAGKYSYGDQTLFDDVVHTLGGINIGSENGLHGYSALNSEQILAWNPEWIVAGANHGETEMVIRKLMDDPAVALTTAARKGQIVVLENNVFMPMSPYTMLLLDALGDALYGASEGLGAEGQRNGFGETIPLLSGGGVAARSIKCCAATLLAQTGWCWPRNLFGNGTNHPGQTIRPVRPPLLCQGGECASPHTFASPSL